MESETSGFGDKILESGRFQIEILVTAKDPFSEGGKLDSNSADTNRLLCI